MKNAFYIIIFGILIFVANASYQNLGFFEGKSETYSNLVRGPYVPPATVDVTLFLTYNDEIRDPYKVTVPFGSSVLDVVKAVATDEDIPFETTGSNEIRITSIKEYANSDSAEWSYMINDEPQPNAPNNRQIKEQDKIEFIFN